ncbi:hypothetical protein WMY93_033162 [Mugilogobius chulae]|uniref:E3 ubiquitin-protein ligase n=1 Tax=Mugilogobius chulae TaxID=88201 RepID=A0AAW0MLY1_9GOBI
MTEAEVCFLLCVKESCWMLLVQVQSVFVKAPNAADPDFPPHDLYLYVVNRFSLTLEQTDGEVKSLTSTRSPLLTRHQMWPRPSTPELVGVLRLCHASPHLATPLYTWPRPFTLGHAPVSALKQLVGGLRLGHAPLHLATPLHTWPRPSTLDHAPSWLAALRLGHAPLHLATPLHTWPRPSTLDHAPSWLAASDFATPLHTWPHPSTHGHAPFTLELVGGLRLGHAPLRSPGPPGASPAEGGAGAGPREEQREELGVQLLLLAPLEWLLLGEEPSAALAALKEANRGSALCGHVFRVGEPTYSCRECAADPTCVLCMNCFLGSVHKDHRYRMTTSGGGGFCDCGDSEAWKQGASCSSHLPKDQDQRQDQDPVQSLDPALVVRATQVFRTVLRYAVDMLTWDQENCLPPGLEPTDKGDTFYCMLFNDEVHTYEQVIYTLQKAVNCDQKEAVSFATTVDREGRTSVRFGDFQFCEQAKSVIVRNSGRQSKPLKVQVMHSSVVAHQVFALKTLGWLSQVISCSDGLRRILCSVALESGPGPGSGSGSDGTLVDRLMLNDSKMWKATYLTGYHQLLMNSLFWRRLLWAELDFLEIFHLTLYFFSIFQNIMTVIIRTFLDHLRHRDLQGRFQFDRYTAQQAFKFGRVQSLIGDLKYILISRTSDWSDELRLKFMDGFEAFLELLRCMQEQVLMQAYRACLSALTQSLSGLADGEQPISLSLAGHMVETFRYQVSQDKVSIHLPLVRMLAGLHVLLSRTEVASRFPEQLPLGELSPPLLVELPLRCLVLCAQVHAGMWRRNGFSLINQIYYYHNVKCRVEMFDKDLIMLQVGASMMDPNHFLMIVLSRFELFHIFSSSDSRRRFRDSNKDLLQQNHTLIEEMLHLIIMIIGERYVAGVGQVQPLDELRREIIHQLCIRPMAHSELIKALPENVSLSHAPATPTHTDTPTATPTNTSTATPTNTNHQTRDNPPAVHPAYAHSELIKALPENVSHNHAHRHAHTYRHAHRHAHTQRDAHKPSDER